MLSHFRFQIILLLAIVSHIQSIVDYCLQNKFPPNQNSLFTKEVINNEYAIRKHFKGLHCCAKDYRSIEWFKNNKPYPWSAVTSGLILYPESGNQTIYSNSVDQLDEGNYTCVIKYNEYTASNTVRLNVLSNSPSIPQATHIPKNIEASLGQRTRFFCEAFIGLMSLPDAHSDIEWLKYTNDDDDDNTDGQLKPVQSTDTVRLQHVRREKNQILGAYLIFENISIKDYGKYVCRVSNTETILDFNVSLVQKLKSTSYYNLELLSKIWCLGLIVFLIMLWKIRISSLVRILYKISKKKRQKINDKENYDVLFCYPKASSEFFLKEFFPKLDNQYSCKCLAFETLANKWAERVDNMYVKRCRAICLLLTDEAISSDWKSNDYNKIVQSFLEHQRPLLLATARPLPKNMNPFYIYTSFCYTNGAIGANGFERYFWQALHKLLV